MELLFLALHIKYIYRQSVVHRGTDWVGQAHRLRDDRQTDWHDTPRTTTWHTVLFNGAEHKSLSDTMWPPKTTNERDGRNPGLARPKKYSRKYTNETRLCCRASYFYTARNRIIPPTINIAWSPKWKIALRVVRHCALPAAGHITLRYDSGVMCGYKMAIQCLDTGL